MDNEVFLKLSPKYLRTAADACVELYYLKSLPNIKIFLHPQDQVLDLEPKLSISPNEPYFWNQFQHLKYVNTFIEVETSVFFDHVHEQGVDEARFRGDQSRQLNLKDKVAYLYLVEDREPLSFCIELLH